MAGYDKLSLASFKESLKSGKYETATAARRGIGKATTLSEEDKEKARKHIDAHFGTEAAPAEKKAKKSAAPKAKKAEAKSVEVKTPKKAAKEAAPKAKKSAHLEEPKTTTSSRRTPITGEKSEQVASTPLPPEHQGQIDFAKLAIEQGHKALGALAHMKSVDPTANLSGPIESVGENLAEAVQTFGRVARAFNASALPPVVQKETLAPTPSISTASEVLPVEPNGASSKGATLFADSLPAATPQA